MWQGSFIHVDDFEGPAALGAYLQQLKNDSVALKTTHLYSYSHCTEKCFVVCDIFPFSRQNITNTLNGLGQAIITTPERCAGWDFYNWH